MVWKAGDSVAIPIVLANNLGQAVTYANAAAFTAAGWSLNWVQAGVSLTSQPTYTLVPDPSTSGLDGRHYVIFALPAGVSTLDVVVPATFYCPNPSQLLIVCANDEDSLAAGFAAGAVTVSATGGATGLTDQSVVEGDGFGFQLPAILASQLSFYDATNKTITSYADLSDIGGQVWTVACQARRAENGGELPTTALAFTLGCVVQSKTLRTLVAGWTTPPTGAQIDDLQATATAVLTSQVLTSITLVTGGMYFSGTPTVAITGGGGSGATATAIMVNGVVTGFTITNGGTGYTSVPTVTLSTVGDGTITQRRFLVDVQLQPPAASAFAGAKLTVFKFNLYITRQQTTSP